MTIWLSRGVVDEIERLGSLYHPVETGGVLLGWRDDGDRIVTGLIGPGPEALHGRHAFLPDHSWQTRHMRKAFGGSAGDLDYLGDWHTHPDGVAAMSNIDCKTLSRIERRVKRPAMVIAAGSSRNWTLAGWLGLRSSFFGALSPKPEPLQLFDPPEGWPDYFVSVEQSG